MTRLISRRRALAGLAIALAAPALADAADETKKRQDAIERYGLAGFAQSIGLHHGFHIQAIRPDSRAAHDRLHIHDVIIKVDGEPIRSREHLLSLLTDAFEDDGLVELTVLPQGSLEHHVVKGHLKPRDDEATAKRSKRLDDDDAPR